jgi:hypothetical protein
MVVVVAFFCNKAIEKGDGTNCYLLLLLLLPKKIVVAFVITTPPEKKVMTTSYYCLFLLLKHKKKKKKKKAMSCLCHHLLRFKQKQKTERRRREKKKKKNHRGKKNAKKGESLPFFSCFCIWDEIPLLPSPLHVPSMLNSPPSLSLVSHVSWKFSVTQAQELSQALEMK